MDKDEYGDHEVAPDKPQSHSLCDDDALQSFDPFNDVFRASAFSYPQAQVFPGQRFNNSRLENIWTENQRGRDLFGHLQSSDYCEDSL